MQVVRTGASMGQNSQGFTPIPKAEVGKAARNVDFLDVTHIGKESCTETRRGVERGRWYLIEG